MKRKDIAAMVAALAGCLFVLPNSLAAEKLPPPHGKETLAPPPVNVKKTVPKMLDKGIDMKKIMELHAQCHSHLQPCIEAQFAEKSTNINKKAITVATEDVKECITQKMPACTAYVPCVSTEKEFYHYCPVKIGLNC